MTALFSSVFCVETGKGSGSFNMDLDRHLMRLFLDGRFQRQFGAGSCLWRFYGWEPAAVSLGRNQDPSEIDTETCRHEGIDIVVRPTGGRAVFHAEELTYSFFAETDVSNEEIYRQVHETIGRALQRAGIPVGFCRSRPDLRKRYASAESVPCFTASARYELQVDSRKIVGSAQRRSGRVMLQHGSIPLSGRHRDIVRYISSKDPALVELMAGELARKTASVDEFSLSGYDELISLLVLEAGGTTGSAPQLLDPVEPIFMPETEAKTIQ